MSHIGVGEAYEVVLGPAAIRAVLGFPDPGDRKGLADALRTELINGPNAEREYTFESDSRSYSDRGAGPKPATYTAIPLSFAAHAAVYRPLTPDELRRLKQEQGRSVARRGFYVVDILPAESAFTRSVPRGRP
jgi:hypothetical protein